MRPSPGLKPLCMIALGCLILSLSWAVRARVFEWKDSQGYHATDNLDKVPEPYRSRFQREIDKAPDAGTPDVGAKADLPPPPPPKAAGQGLIRKVEEMDRSRERWSSRAKAMGQRVDDAKARWKQAEAAMGSLINQSPAYLTGDQREAQRQARRTVERFHAEVGRAERALTAFQEEARKAGVPPGWVR